jgi:hypothetical protein
MNINDKLKSIEKIKEDRNIIIIEDLNNDENIDDENIDDENIDDENIDDENIDDETIYFKFNTTKHKLEGKHSLKRDTIFQGKESDEEENNYSSNSDYYSKDFLLEKGTMFEIESRNYEELEIQRRLKNDIYEILKKRTELDFNSNRRKPNKQVFNNYYKMLLDELHNRYTKSEIFVELSYYFTDHVFNMYKLLYPEHATNIIKELKSKGYLDELDDMEFV